MQCPADSSELEEITPHGVVVHRCAACNGVWFSAEHLRKLKDAEDPFLRWIDVDPWENPEKFRVARGQRACPEDGTPLYAAQYNDSGITVDVCGAHHGVWLDEGEFREIADWMHARIARESFLGYLRDTGVQAAEIIVGPESLWSETLDFYFVAKLLAYKLLSRFPALGELMTQLPT